MRSTWVLLVAVLILASSAETLAAPVAVTQGFYQTTSSDQAATFSGDNNLAVSFTTGGGIGSKQVFTTGILDGGLGSLGPPFLVGGGPGGPIQADNGSCNVPANPNCGAALRFINQVIPIGAPNLPNGSFAGDAAFTMTGQLQIGNQIVDIVGSGFLHAECTFPPLCGPGSVQRYNFAVAEPSTVVLMLSGLIAIGWSRWRGGKRAGSNAGRRTTMKHSVLVITLSAGVFALMSGAADAITVTFNDLTDTVTVDVMDLPVGVTVTRNTVQFPLGPAAEATQVVIIGAFVPPAELMALSGEPGAVNLSLTEGPVVLPRDSVLNRGSDLISVGSTPPIPPELGGPSPEFPQIRITFQSDAEVTFFPAGACAGNFLCKFEGDPNPAFTGAMTQGGGIVADGTFSLLNAQGNPFNPSARLVINAFSDVERVPEPVTLLLLGSGLVGLGVLSYRRRRAR